MVWRAPVFPKQNTIQGRCVQTCNRYARSVKDPASHGLCMRDYDSRHKARAWPQPSEYTHAYCSNYAPPADDRYRQQEEQRLRFQCLEHLLKQQEEEECKRQCQYQQQNLNPFLNQQHPPRQPQQHQQHQQQQRQQQYQQHDVPRTAQYCAQFNKPQDACIQKDQTSMPGATYPSSQKPQHFKLMDPTPMPLSDKHYRGAHYKPGHAMGVQVPEELTRVRQTSEGPVRISCEEDMSNYYLPNYRYQEWASQSEYKVWRDCNTDAILVRQPDAPTEAWDFYNEVRMRRPAKKMADPQFEICRTIPIPRDTDIELPQQPPYDPCASHYGRFSTYRFEESAFHRGNLCQC